MKRRQLALRFAIACCFWVAAGPAVAQSRADTGKKELERKAPPGTIAACPLITRSDVQKATGRDPYSDPAPAGQGGWICNVGTAELKVYAGAKSTEAWESTLRNFKADKEPRVPAPAFGPGAYFIFLKARNAHVSSSAILVAKKGDHTVVLSVDAPDKQPAEAARPAAESLMKTVLGRM